jgi:hypothetical protein
MTTPMVDLYRELRSIVDVLDEARVDYALAGGLAVSVYTVPRATEDIDLVLAAGDLERAVRALRPLGFQAAGRPMVVATGRLQIQRLIRIEGPDLLALDLLTAHAPSLTHLLTDRRAIDWEGRPIWIVGIASLREMKRLRGSTRDRADLEALGPGPP